MKKGLVIKSTGSWYDVQMDDQEVFQCRIRGKFRLKGLKLTNPVAVGDVVGVEIEDEEEKTGVITRIFDRENYVIRQSPRKKHMMHLIASNLDQAILIVTMVKPRLKQGFIDRFLLMTEPYHIPVTILFNKADLYSEEDLIIYEYMESIYNRIGYTVKLISALQNDATAYLKDLLRDKTSLLAGQSGVGKSTLINNIQPQLDLKTATVSEKTEKGQHTTTFAQLFELDFGGRIIDTPGIKNLSFNNFEIMDVAHNFTEFFELSRNCRYDNCTHRNEPKCAVKAGIESGLVSEFRYNNYLQIIEEIEDQNYWERHSM
jgi:ribosome biogenesis GTPase